MGIWKVPLTWRTCVTLACIYCLTPTEILFSYCVHSHWNRKVEDCCWCSPCPWTGTRNSWSKLLSSTAYSPKAITYSVTMAGASNLLQLYLTISEPCSLKLFSLFRLVISTKIYSFDHIIFFYTFVEASNKHGDNYCHFILLGIFYA